MPLLPLLGDPNANRSLIQWVDWAGQWPEGRTPTPTPSRKKERLCPAERKKERERERVAILAQVLHLCLGACAALLPGGEAGG